MFKQKLINSGSHFRCRLSRSFLLFFSCSLNKSSNFPGAPLAKKLLMISSSFIFRDVSISSSTTFATFAAGVSLLTVLDASHFLVLVAFLRQTSQWSTLLTKDKIFLQCKDRTLFSLIPPFMMSTQSSYTLSFVSKSDAIYPLHMRNCSSIYTIPLTELCVGGKK